MAGAAGGAGGNGGGVFGGLSSQPVAGWNVWDYSDQPFNLLGQICLSYTLLWIPLSAVAIVLDDFLRCLLFGEEWPRYTLR